MPSRIKISGWSTKHTLLTDQPWSCTFYYQGVIVPINVNKQRLNKPGWYSLIVSQFLEAASCSISDLILGVSGV